jgi:outer membrane protein assembly factor BamD (BamD/ComL family)
VSLSAERALLETARAAVARGQSGATIGALRRHEQEFPQGRLAEERESLWVQALVMGGQYDEARARAARFRQKFPDSMLLPAVESAVGSIP